MKWVNPLLAPARLTLSTRLVLLGLVGLLALWLVGLAAFFLRHDEYSPLALLPPERVAAMVAVLEPATDANRAAMLRALHGPAFAARIDDAPPDEPASAPLAPLAPAYRAALAGREAAFFRPERPGVLAPVARLQWRFRDEFDLVVSLRDGRFLVLAARPPHAVSPLGLPIGLASGLVSALVALAVLIGVMHQVRPLRKLAAALDKVDLDGGPEPIASPAGGAPEIRSLAAAFARLQARLATLLHARLALIGGISHDLRTFATRLRLRVEGIADARERAAAVQDITDMMRLLDDSLLATQAGVGELRQELVALIALAHAEAAARRRAGATVSLVAAPRAQAIGDPLALRRILANLVDNALKYGGRADIAVATRGEWVVVAVEDRGPGIPPGARRAVLEPFARLEPSRSRDRGGAGLGLAVARNLARAQGGEIEIADRPGGGARVALRLPLFAVVA
jgi:signal transduction histidine kinase